MFKACHITSAHSRYDDRIFYKECISLASSDYDVSLLVADGLPDEIRNNIFIHSVQMKQRNRIYRIINAPRKMAVAALNINADLYHLHDPELLPLAKALKSHGKIVVFDSHENYVAQIKTKEYIPGYLRNAVSCIYSYYETSALESCDAVIVPCTFNNGVNIFNNRCKTCAIISNASKLSEFYNKYDSRSSRDCRAICHVGGLTYERGITHLVQSAYKADMKLILAGNFSPDGYFEKIKNMKEFQCVDYRGFKTREELVSLYEESSVGIATILNVGQYNIADNFPTKVYEYMSMGLPVILSKYPFAEKMLKKYEFGIAVDPANIDEIASAIRYLRENPNKAKQMGENGRRAILEEFNWSIEEKKLLKLYDDLVNA